MWRTAVVAALASGCRFSFDAIGDDGGTDATNSVDATPCPTCEAGLVAHYLLDEVGGAAVTERVAMRDGTTMGNTEWAPGSGIHGGAIRLLGNGYVQADWAVEQTVMSTMTVAMWVNLEPTSPAFARFMSSYYWNGANNGVFEMEAGDVGLICRFFTGGAWTSLFTSGAVSPGAWHHVGCVYDGAAVIAYLDGVEVDRKPATGAIAASETVPFSIGASIQPGNIAQNRMIGLADDARVYDRVLTPAELALLATAP